MDERDKVLKGNLSSSPIPEGENWKRLLIVTLQLSIVVASMRGVGQSDFG